MRKPFAKRIRRLIDRRSEAVGKALRPWLPILLGLICGILLAQALVHTAHTESVPPNEAREYRMARFVISLPED